MEKWKERFLCFAGNKIYVLLLSLTAAAAYGFMITHHAIGMDDTPYALYFEEGMSAIVGRWVTYLLNKVVMIGDFVPYLTDFAGVVILMAAVTVWCALLYGILGDRIPKYGYLFFACIFLSCPLISEVYVYHLHNGIAIGYLCSGISLCLFVEGMRWNKKSIVCFVGSLVSLWVALGCYESFMMVWLMGVCVILMLQRMCGERVKVLASIGVAGAVAFAGMLLRSVMIAAVTAIFHLEALRDQAAQRSVTELLGWIFQEGAWADFAMGIKRTYLMYVVFGCAYYPIGIFVLATVIILLAALIVSICRKDAWIFLLAVAAYAAAFSLVVIEGKETYYRCAQFLPVVCGLGCLMFAWGVGLVCEKVNPGVTAVFATAWKKRAAGACRGLAVVILSVILWNQCADMNRWFYMDWQKYEAAKETIYNVAYELDKGFDTSKPIVFTGVYEIPSHIIQDAFVSYGSKEYATMQKLTNWLDPNLLGKYHKNQGVWVVQQPMLSVIEWGKTAFDGNQELINFFEMHGIDLEPCPDMATYEAAVSYSMDMPTFPQEGSIVDMGDYVLVHF